MEIMLGFLLVLVFSALVYFPIKHAVSSVLCNKCNKKICICTDEVYINDVEKAFRYDDGQADALMLYDTYTKRNSS
jgi:hypothetical protein